MKIFTAFIFVITTTLNTQSTSAESPTVPTVIVVIGASGTPAYGREFSEWTKRWESAALDGGANFVTVGQSSAAELSDKAILENEIGKLKKESPAPVWLVLIGHGTWDYRDAKFNLRGPDVSHQELAGWLAPLERPLAVINCTSSSAPFLPALSRPNCVTITATKNGSEMNFAKFGNELSRTIADPTADLDKDGQTSLLEAWLMAARRIDEHYKTEGQLATEHSLLDDNADARGTPADWYRGIRLVKKGAETEQADGFLAHQFHLVRSSEDERLGIQELAKRNQLEAKIHQLRQQKSKLAEAEYFAELESLLVEMAELYVDERRTPVIANKP